MKESDLEIGLRKRLDAAGYTGYVQEHMFHPTRRWRFDFAWPDLKLAIEIQGGTHIGGRHTRGSSVEEDYIKFNSATVLGWSVLQVTGDQVRSGYALSVLDEFMASRKGCGSQTAQRCSERFTGVS